jgi:hypothetical protein
MFNSISDYHYFTLLISYGLCWFKLTLGHRCNGLRRWLYCIEGYIIFNLFILHSNSIYDVRHDDQKTAPQMISLEGQNVYKRGLLDRPSPSKVFIYTITRLSIELSEIQVKLTLKLRSIAPTQSNMHFNTIVAVFLAAVTAVSATPAANLKERDVQKCGTGEKPYCKNEGNFVPILSIADSANCLAQGGVVVCIQV